jgi:exopolyphosphatase/guanosine-5'-triphosphate,3'-diphosphate pyrophosphatase
MLCDCKIVRTVDNDPQELFKKVEFVRIPVRLGDDAFKDGKISKDKARIFNKAMKAYMLMMEVFEVDYYMACATSALRKLLTDIKWLKRFLKKRV